MYANRAYNSLYNLSGGTNSFTIETWYYETTKSYNCTIVDKANYNMLFLIRNQNLSNPQGLSFYNTNMGWLYAESAVVPVQQWCHLAIMKNGSSNPTHLDLVKIQKNKKLKVEKEILQNNLDDQLKINKIQERVLNECFKRSN